MKKQKKQLVPVSRRSIEQRINRALAKDGETLKRTRWGRLDATGHYIPSRARLDLGEYYTINLTQNCIIEKNLDLEDYARELKVLEDYEALESEKEEK